LKFEEVELMQQFLVRQKNVGPKRAEALGKELSKKIGDRLGVPEEQRGEWQQFLPGLLQAYGEMGEKNRDD